MTTAPFNPPSRDRGNIAQSPPSAPPAGRSEGPRASSRLPRLFSRGGAGPRLRRRGGAAEEAEGAEPAGAAGVTAAADRARLRGEQQRHGPGGGGPSGLLGPHHLHPGLVRGELRRLLLRGRVLWSLPCQGKSFHAQFTEAQVIPCHWNTLSNLIMILPPIYGAIQTVKDGLEKRYTASYLAITVVGLGSWCFHMTLQYEMQLLDELPMIYSCCIFVYCMFESFKTKNTVNYHLIFILVLFSLIVTTVYLKVKEPIFHQVMYGLLVFALVLRSIYIVTWVYPWLRGLGYTSLGIFLMGFFLWNVDNIFCDSLRRFRTKVPPFVGVFTQLHAWWHILTGLGSYLHVLFSLYTRTLFLRYRPKVKFLLGMWPTILVEPPKKDI
ncbi:alkaline ceramidase 3 isoform X1 [Sarcophilus harrisii]|nr:alkaline ceramidase 3 isoform X1 [Sarcophilus harrisii]